MRIHPEIPFQTKRHNVKNFHSRCGEERLHCPFDEGIVESTGHCDKCGYKKKKSD